MDIGICILFDGRPGNTMRDVAPTARFVEECGFSTLWYPDHVVTFEDYAPNYPYTPDKKPPVLPRQGWYECLIALAAAATATSRIRLGTSVLILPERNPALLAKEVVALDHLSGGRFNLGIGVGWSPEEFSALGVPFERRGARANEYLEAMNRLWQDELASYEGEFVSFKDAVAYPKPIQKPRPPIIVGGESGPALRRAATMGDGWMSGALPLEKLPSTLDRLDAACHAVGRDPAELRRTYMSFYTTPDALEEQIKVAEGRGVDEVAAILPWIDLDLDSQGAITQIAKVGGLS